MTIQPRQRSLWDPVVPAVASASDAGAPRVALVAESLLEDSLGSAGYRPFHRRLGPVPGTGIVGTPDACSPGSDSTGTRSDECSRVSLSKQSFVKICL